MRIVEDFLKDMRTWVCVLLLLGVFTSCRNDAKETVQTGDFKLEFLFEHEGCKVYRFKDGGRYIYWTTCPGRLQSDTYKSGGKGGHTENMESITTEVDTTAVE